MPAAAAASATANAAKASGREKLCAIAPVASGAGRRVSALNSDAEERPIAGCVPVWRAARAKPQGTMAPVPMPISAKPATLCGETTLRGDDRKSGGGDRERSEDDPLVAEPEPDDIGIEAQRRLAGGKKRGPETGDRRKSRRLCAQQDGRPERGRRLGGNRDADDDAEPDQGRREGEASRRRRQPNPGRLRLAHGGAAIGKTGRGKSERGGEPRRPRRRAGDDQAAENRSDRHPGRRRPMQAREDRPAEAPFDPGAFGIHGHVDDAAEKAGPDQNPADRRRGPCVQERAQGRSERYRADHKDLSYAEGMGERAARRHRDQIGGRVGGKNHAEGGGIDVSARENRARGAAPKADADPEREKHSGDRRVHASGIARRNLRGYGFQKSVGAPPSALRRATKASSASRRSGSNGGGA